MHPLTHPATAPTVRERIVFLNLARALGALLVVYSNFSMIRLPARHWHRRG